MSLPKVFYPTFTITIPSTKKVVSFRPFLVKEEKLLLMAKESKSDVDILTSVKQVVNNCCLEKNLNFNNLPIFDLEYIFLKLRMFSVENICKVSYIDTEDDKVYDFDINLEEIKVTFPENENKNIKINDKMGIIMKYPTASLYDDQEYMAINKNYLFETIVRCIDKIYEDDNIYESSDYKISEITEFVENLDNKTFGKINDFLTRTPSIKHEIKYNNSLGNERKIVLSSLNDFFTLR